jgi:phage terminase large subunit
MHDNEVLDRDETGRRILERWARNPVQAVRELFGAEPDAWQAEALMEWARGDCERLAFKACKGPGKTTVLAWMILIFLLTRKESKIAATSITADNLGDNLWAECSKWMSRSKVMMAAFKWTKTRIVRKDNPNWFAAARTWPKSADAQRQSDTLAGLHADHIMFVLDESGGIPQAVMATAEAVLATGKETKIVQGGNPTHLEGPLYRACTVDRHLWKVITITGDPDNPKRSPRIKLDWARQQIATYGRENPWVKVNVLGEFPPASINALFGSEEIEIAMARVYTPDVYNWSQKRLGIDVARFGDDRTVIFPRQGLMSFTPDQCRKLDTLEIAARVMRARDAWGSEMQTIDCTGQWANGTIDQLRTAKVPIIPVDFGDKAINPKYLNRRAEMWLELSKWVKAGGRVPPVPEMIGEFITPTYTFSGGKFMLEPKDMVKERLGRSPDLVDGLALTFALPDMPGGMDTPGGKRGHVTGADWDPYAIAPQ